MTKKRVILHQLACPSCKRDLEVFVEWEQSDDEDAISLKYWDEVRFEDSRLIAELAQDGQDGTDV